MFFGIILFSQDNTFIRTFNIAGMNGNEIGVKNAAIIEKKMLVGQIAIAVGLARNWKK